MPGTRKSEYRLLKCGNCIFFIIIKVLFVVSVGDAFLDLNIVKNLVGNLRVVTMSWIVWAQVYDLRLCLFGNQRINDGHDGYYLVAWITNYINSFQIYFRNLNFLILSNLSEYTSFLFYCFSMLILLIFPEIYFFRKWKNPVSGKIISSMSNYKGTL